VLGLELRLLGPVEWWVDDAPVPAGTTKQRCVLAVLALEANHVVPVETVIDRVWDDTPPDAARALVQTYVARIRRSFADSGIPAVLTYRSGGYALTIDPDLVDSHRFRRLTTSSSTVDDLRAALSLWHGEPLSGLAGSWARSMRDTLAGQRLSAQRRLLDLRLAAGAADELLGELDELLASHPLDEKLIEQRMLALYRAGRQADALDCYREARTCLREEVGDEPGPDLRDLHLKVLRRDPELNRLARPAPAPAPVPRQLPARTPFFVGREDKLAQLDKLMDSGDTVVISAIDGTAGVGKTALAIHWAHEVADRFPGGQLYANLRGFHTSGTPMDPAEALRGFLEALGVAPDQLPATLDAQSALYRSLLAGRQVLVVLDNARDPDQVRPLLPGSPGCVAVVTSRSQLAGLVAQEGAHPVSLDALGHDEAFALLTRRLGHERVEAEPDAVAELVDHCARLPLALTIVAARAAVDERLPLGALTEELRDSASRLDALDAGEERTNVRTVFSWSYQHLSVPTARMFRLLGVHPGQDITLPAAESLSGEPGARPLLRELARAHVLVEHRPGRFACHDLLRAYAADQVDDTERSTALHRVLDHYLHTAHTAARLLDPARDAITLPPPQPGVRPQPLRDYAQAWAWCAAEHQVLLSTVAEAARAGFDVHAWQISWALSTFLQRRGHWHDWAATQHTAVAAAERLGDRDAQARAHRSLGYAHILLGRDARTDLRRADELYGATGNPAGQAHVRLTLAWVFEKESRYAEALEQARQALSLYRTGGHRVGEANAMAVVGWYHAQLGDHGEALESCEHALRSHRELGDRDGQANTLYNLGYAHHHLGHHSEAIAYYRQAIDLRRALGDRYYEADVLTNLGDTHQAAGDLQSARDAWQRALAILTDLHHPDADALRARLDAT
jgi:DNA-binding SARP family transcriptional activator/Tfp pilus assembly protein PilF